MPSLEHSPHNSSSFVDERIIPLVVIVGPTAVGKTEIAIELAERINGEIVSADSRLFYRGMDIGTAKPTIEQRKRIPHHLIDVANPDEPWSLAVFQREANRAIKEIFQAHHQPILVGGTGQFVHAVTEGWKIPAAHPDPQLREALNRWAVELGGVGLHARLAIVDPEAARSIDPSNVRRTIRALEVVFSTGRQFSGQRIKGDKLFDTLMIGLTRPRPELYQRIDERIDNMIASGFIDEVRHLLDLGYAPGLPTLSAIGYGEIGAYLQGNVSLDEAILLIKRRTRVFVRRQANWFKQDDSHIRWLTVDEGTVDELERIVVEWITEVK